jgi:hypothetical protein
MKSSLLLFAICLLHAQIFSQHSNLQISNANFPEEPSIMISSKNPKYIVAGANIRNAYYSSDTGRTWTGQLLSSPFGVYGDPAIICDTNGVFYYFHLSDPPGTAFIDQIVCQTSADNGATWTTGVSIGLNASKAQDKQWAVVNKATNTIYTTWTQFDNYGSTSPSDSSIIRFSKSSDGGVTWTTPIRINQKSGNCVDSDSTVEGAVPAIGPNGEIYVAWAGPDGLIFDKSLDGGTTWMTTDKVITSTPGWDFNVPGIYRANGLPITLCDISNSPNRGTIYVNWTDQRNGIADTDVWLVKSTNGGTTWSAPIRVNNDAAGKQQFFTWMAIDQRNGYLYFVFYDRRSYSDNQTDVYMARSTDGGNTFANFKISATSFVPTSSVFFGDYSNLSVEKGIIRPMWTRMDNGNLSVWTSLIDTTAIPGTVTGINNPDMTIETLLTYPNPFTNNSFVSFKLRRPGIVSIEVFDVNGEQLASPVNAKWYLPGKYTEKINIQQLHLTPGAYFYRIIINGNVYTRKLIMLD